MLSFIEFYQLIVEEDMRKPIVNRQPDVNDPEYRAKTGQPYQIGVNKSRQLKDVGAHLDRKKDPGYASNYDRPDEHPGMATSTAEEVQGMGNLIASEIYKIVSNDFGTFKPGADVPVNTVVRVLNQKMPTVKPDQIMQAIALLSNMTKQKMHSPLFKYSQKSGMHLVHVIPYGNPGDQEHAHGGRYLNQKLKPTQSEVTPETMSPQDVQMQAQLAKMVKEYKAQKGLNNQENAMKVAQQMLLLSNQIMSSQVANPKLKAVAAQLREKLQNVA